MLLFFHFQRIHSSNWDKILESLNQLNWKCFKSIVFTLYFTHLNICFSHTQTFFTIGGMVLQTNMSDILARIDDQNRLVKQEAGLSAAPAAVVHQLKSMNLPQQFKDMKLPDLPQAIKVIQVFKSWSRSNVLCNMTKNKHQTNLTFLNYFRFFSLSLSIIHLRIWNFDQVMNTNDIRNRQQIANQLCTAKSI